MSRQAQNQVFAMTSFLHGANAAYIEELQAQYDADPQSVSPEWQQFFRGLSDGNGHGHGHGNGKTTRSAAEADMLDAFGANFGGDATAQAAVAIRDKVQARAQSAGFDLSAAAAFRATQDSIRALMLIRAYRAMGHLAADLDPLGLDNRRTHKELRPETYGFTEADLDRPIFIDKVLGLEMATVRQILAILRRTYCQHVGIEFMHITSPLEKAWLQERIEGEGKEVRFTTEGKRAILRKLVEAEGFEKFSDVKYTGTKRFGLEGGEAMIPALEQIIKRGGQLGVKEIVIGMAHRGRLNVLGNVMSKPLRAIFNEFKGGSFKPDDVEGSGDVKYHLGASSDREFDGNKVHLSLTANPSHLEIVDPVVLGKVRAKQDQHGCKPDDRRAVLPLLIHGDAAFAGQGVVAECFGLSGLKGHRTGGSIHFVINNQIGFTTNPRFSRSSPYCTDVAKMVEAPIFHVNGDDPEAVVYAAKVATEYRMRFQKPVVIDMICYRRHGHNETDEPAFTQPIMYKAIKAHTTVPGLYGTQLVDEGVISQDEFDGMTAEVRGQLDTEMKAAEAYKPNKADWLDGRWSSITPKSPVGADEARRGNTGVAVDRLREIGRRLTTIPNDFNAHKTIARLLENRRKMVESGEGIDWAMAEHLAFGTLVADKVRVRLSGQDCERGTFSQRHSVLNDQVSERRYTPLKYVSPDQSSYEVINSMLSEEAVLGFEYGYSLAEPNALVCWEAQFGDFANGAQVIFDQFLCSGESKWLRMSGLVCLLPHGYEGQGPEHSSARLERFLQLSAEDNWQVANCTTPANYFHILRRQIHRTVRKPLVLMTPKSLLRHKRVVSRIEELGPGTSFHRVLWDDAQFLTPQQRTGEKVQLKPDGEIKRVVLCSGKVYYDLYDAREALGLNDVYLMRVEQLYPFPETSLLKELGRFKNADLVWCQEEPRNMGGWYFIEPELEGVLTKIGGKAKRARYAGRTASASTATGLASRHAFEQKQLVQTALAG
jgi:2-oxoglutarate dehydrogenase E1 component